VDDASGYLAVELGIMNSSWTLTWDNTVQCHGAADPPYLERLSYFLEYCLTGHPTRAERIFSLYRGSSKLRVELKINTPQGFGLLEGVKIHFLPGSCRLMDHAVDQIRSFMQ
jgi:hypothetical protein